MADLWSPYAIRDPGDSAGFRFGENEMRLACVHCTAGRNSYELVKWGGPDRGSLSFQLYPKVGQPWQFCEINALTHDSPPNNDGPGFEIERMPESAVPVRPGLTDWEPLTPDQLHWLQLNVQWMHDEHGFPLNLYDGPRLHGGVPGFHGFANHGDIDSQRSDGVTREEWEAITSGPPPLPTEEDDMKGTLVHAQGTQFPYALMTGAFRSSVGLTPKAINEMVDKSLVTNKRKDGNVEYVELTSDVWTALIDLDVIVPKLLKLP